MILSAQSIRKLCINQHFDPMLTPFFEQTKFNGKTYGLGPCGYDIRLRQTLVLWPGSYVLGSTMEHFCIPTDIMARVADKSSWARLGITMQNTILEPNWCGVLTLEIANHNSIWNWFKPWKWRTLKITIPAGSPIAQVVFEQLDAPTDTPYNGKYQNQGTEPTPAIHEL